MKLLESLRGQTVTIVLACLLASNLAGYVLYSRGWQVSFLLEDGFDMVERAAGAHRLLRDIPDAWTPYVMEASISRAFYIWTSRQPSFDNPLPEQGEKDLKAYFENQDTQAGQNEIRVGFRQYPPKGLRIPQQGQDSLSTNYGVAGTWAFVLAVKRSNGRWLNFVGHIAPDPTHLPTFLVFNLISAAIGLGIVAVWLVGRTTAPLRQLAEAASRLGRNLNSEPLKENGPIEIAVAARAFNGMQRRLINHIESRTGMLAAISHDLRTPITQIRLRTELAPASEERDKTLAALDEMNTIIATFLDYARASSDTEQRSIVDFGSLIESVCDDLADAGADVSCRVDDQIRYTCRRVALKRAVSNIISNAVTHGGIANVAALRTGHEVLLTVEDAGAGIPESEQEAVFQPFHRLRCSGSENREGIGLGLSIAKMIVEDQGGTIRLLNRREGGLRVEIRLPDSNP